MMKKIIFIFFILIFSFSYSQTHWSGTNYQNSLVVLYKALDPLIVTVDQPQKIIIPASRGTYKYSLYSQSKRTLNVKVTAQYNKDKIDDILRKVYERVYFKLQNNGEFDLIHKDQNDKKIKGKGFFVDNDSNASETNKLSEINKAFAGSVGDEKFSATTEIDAEFTIDDVSNVPMGVYSGTLKLDVWFGGSIQ